MEADGDKKQQAEPVVTIRSDVPFEQWSDEQKEAFAAMIEGAISYIRERATTDKPRKFMVNGFSMEYHPESCNVSINSEIPRYADALTKQEPLNNAARAILECEAVKRAFVNLIVTRGQRVIG